MTLSSLTYVVPRWNQPTETFVRREVAAAMAGGVEVRVVSLKPPCEPDGTLDDDEIEVICPGWRDLPAVLLAVLRSPVASVGGLLDIVRLGRPRTWVPHAYAWMAAHAVARRVQRSDVLVAHFAWVSATAAHQLWRLTGKPYVVFAHAYGIYERRCQDRHLTHRLRLALAVFVESGSIAADVNARHGVDPVVMRMGVPASFVGESVSPSSSGRMVLSVGALREKKGHDTLIEATAELDGGHLVIAGEGPERSRLEALVTTLGVQHRVTLLGHCDGAKVRELLDEASVFCLASRPTGSGDRDGVPNVLIEAMARGVPVVASAVSGIPDLLDGVGRLVPPADVGALASALRAVFAAPDEALESAARGLERIRDEYTTEANWDRMAATIADRLDVRRPGAGRT
jgi:colanic acid/amylovoran biosynthesis glycosyltransferase